MGLSLIGEHQLTKLLLKQYQFASLHLFWSTDANMERQLYELQVANEE